MTSTVTKSKKTKLPPKRQIDRSVKIKAGLIHPNPWNPYANKSDRLQEAIAESINEFDQIQDLVVRPHPEIEGAYQILDGEGRHRTFSPDEEVYATIVHGLTDGQAKKITIVMDETRAAADKIELSALLAELANDTSIEDLMSGLPYDQAGLDDLIKMAEVDWDQFSDDFTAEESPEGAHDKDEEGWKTVYAKVPDSVFDLLGQVKGLVDQERSLHQKPEIAWGQVLEVMAAEYLAMPR
jgi:hypothetical protein